MGTPNDPVTSRHKATVNLNLFDLVSVPSLPKRLHDASSSLKLAAEAAHRPESITMFQASLHSVAGLNWVPLGMRSL